MCRYCYCDTHPHMSLRYSYIIFVYQSFEHKYPPTHTVAHIFSQIILLALLCISVWKIFSLTPISAAASGCIAEAINYEYKPECQRLQHANVKIETAVYEFIVPCESAEGHCGSWASLQKPEMKYWERVPALLCLCNI